LNCCIFWPGQRLISAYISFYISKSANDSIQFLSGIYKMRRTLCELMYACFPAVQSFVQHLVVHRGLRAVINRKNVPGSSRKHLLRNILLLLGCTGCAVMITTTLSSSHTKAPEVLQHVQIIAKGHATSPYNVAGEYYHLEVKYSPPQPLSLVTRARYATVNSSRTCWDIAKAHKEPFTDAYMPTGQAPTVSGITDSCHMCSW
jgi:uncharacterized CHY-type Zn-finger protein